MRGMISLCMQCVYYRNEGRPPEICLAYPNGIPDKFLKSEAEHTQPEPGDGGYQFRSRLDVRISKSVSEL
jgi:hypothetical protein